MGRRQTRHDETDMKPAEIVDAWAALYSTLPPYLGENEHTQSMIAREMGVDLRAAKRQIAEWIAKGELVEVGIRRSRTGRSGMAYKLNG